MGEKERKKEDKCYRDKWLVVRLTKDEEKQLKRLVNASGINKSSYVKQAVFNKKILSSIDIKTVFQIKKIGVNLNQISRSLHIIKINFDPNIDIKEIQNEIKSLSEQLKKITESITTPFNDDSEN